MDQSPENWPFPIPAAPMGALRILSRRGDSEVLILHGEDRAPADGERLAFIEWFDSIEIAKAISHTCSARLLPIASFKPDADGWHPFLVEHLKTLVALAKTELHLTIQLPEPKPAPVHQAWTKERVARLGVLVGQGLTAKAIADDPLIRSTVHAVYCAAHRFGMSLADVSPGRVPLSLPGGVLGYFQRRAEREQVTTQALIRRLLIGIATASEQEAV